VVRSPLLTCTGCYRSIWGEWPPSTQPMTGV
jgi:hypothetical protein